MAGYDMRSLKADLLPGLVAALHGIAASAIALALLWAADMVTIGRVSGSGHALQALQVVGSEGLIVVMAVYLASFGLTGLWRHFDALITTLFTSMAFVLGFVTGFAVICLLLDPLLGVLGSGGARRIEAALWRGVPVYLLALIGLPVAETLVARNVRGVVSRAMFTLLLVAGAVAMVLYLPGR